MNTLILVTVALLPAILLWFYIWAKDPKKEPTSQLLKAVLYGIIICVPIAFVEAWIQGAIFGDGEITTFFDTTIVSFFIAALPEETFKLLALWLILRKNPYYDEHFDGIVYAVCVGLGFAAVENISYFFRYEEYLMSLAIGRSLLAVPGHYAFAILMGYYYSIYTFVDDSPKVAACILLVPVLAHGIYDTLAMSGLVNELVGSIAFLVLIYFCIKMHKRAYRKVVALIEKDKNISSTT